MNMLKKKIIIGCFKYYGLYLNRRGQMDEHAFLHVIGRMIQINRSRVAGRNMNRVGALVFQHFGNQAGFIHGQAPVNVFIAADPADDRKIRPDLPAHLLEDCQGNRARPTKSRPYSSCRLLEKGDKNEQSR